MNTSTNPYHDFLRKIYRMRRAQKQAEQTKTKSSVAAAKNAEREVDQIIERAMLQSAQVKQLQLTTEDPA